MEKLDYYTLFYSNEKLVPYIFNRYYTDLRYAEQDLLQSGRLGLWKACLKFNPDKKTKFSVFAFKCIKAEMGQCARKEIQYRNLCDFEDVDNLTNDIDLEDYLELEQILKDSNCKTEFKDFMKGKTIKQIAEEKGKPYLQVQRKLKREKEKLKEKYME